MLASASLGGYTDELIALALRSNEKLPKDRPASIVAIHEGQKSLDEKAQDAMENKDYQDAIRLYRKAIDTNPTDLDVWMKIAEAFAYAGRCHESKDAIHRAQDLASDSSVVDKPLFQCSSCHE